MDNSPNWSRKQDESHSPFLFHCKLFKNTLDFIRGLINLNYFFNMLFKASPKTKVVINVGFILQFHDGVHSKILPSLRSVFQAFYKEGYVKINKL